MQARGDHHRNVCIIPVSAHGTNPASAAMCGMKIITVGTDSKGNINIPELKKAAEANKDNLSALMVLFLRSARWEFITDSDLSYILAAQLFITKF